MKFSEDVVPISDLKINPGKIVSRTADTSRPILLTRRGRGVAVLQDLQEFERKEEESDFMRAVVKGLLDVKNDRTMSLEDVRKKLGMA